MGVRRLTTYARYRYTLWTNFQLQDTVILVDGLALVWFLYQDQRRRIDCRCGGEYDEFAQIIRDFFNSMISHRVSPYVLIDGPTLCPTSRQENEILRSHQLSMEDCDDFVLPLMAKLAFVQELRNLGIRFVICDGEADPELAALANHWNCPIISNDSDFFIYDLPAGYIPLSSLDLTSRPMITARLYRRPRLARLLRIPEDFLPLFASLMGNDYVSEETLAPFKKALFPGEEDITRIRTNNLIMTIANFISRCKSPSEALQSAVDLADLYALNHSEDANSSDSDENEETDSSSSSDNEENDLKSHIEASMSEYEISNNSFRGYFDQNETRTSRETRHHKRIPAYVIRSYRDGRFPVGYMGALVDCDGAQILKCQVEDTSKESVHMCSIAIRSISYGIVTEGPTILEFDREKNELVDRTFQPFFGTLSEYGKIPNLNNLREVEKIHRLRLLLIVLKSDTELIKALPERFQVFAASTRYWISKARPAVTKIWVQALLLVHLRLLDKSGERVLHNRRLRVRFDIRCQHSYAQWQSVMMEAMLLNQILIFPLPEPDVSTLYSGIAAQTIGQEITQGAQVDHFLESMEVYDQLYAAVTEDLGVDAGLVRLRRRKGVLLLGGPSPRVKDKHT